MGTRPILAFHSRNCVKFVRVTYYFDTEIDSSFFDHFKTFKCEVNEFSKFVAGSKDHFKMASFEPAILISGVLGEKCIEVAYGKFSQRPPEDDIKKFEEQLIRIGFGSHIVECKRNLVG